MQSKTHRIALTTLIALSAVVGHAADVVVQPASGSGFVIKDANGANERLRVQDNGQISLPGVVAAGTQTQALCIGAAGLLGPCGGGGGGSYAAGAGLVLAGATFSVAPRFQLPQTCAANQMAQWSGSAWACGTAGSGGVPGSGALNYVAKWTPDGASLGKSVVFDDGTNAGIGTTLPANKLQIGNLGGSGYNGNHIAFGDTQGAGLYQGDTFLQFGSTTNMRILPKNGTGAVGINTSGLPVNKLQIGNLGSSNYHDSHIAYGDAQASSLYQGDTFTQWYSTTDMRIEPKNGSGHVGINTSGVPVNALQIGNLGSSAFSGYHIAFGDSQAAGLEQTNAYMQFASTTDISLFPQGGNGHVGINTNTPRAPLDVEGSSTINGSQLPDAGYYAYFALGHSSSFSEISASGICRNCDAPVSIYASARVMAEEFDAFSDARIKDIKGASSSSHDLDTLNAIEVVDYTMKDKAKHGSRPYKKVIAQQVEEVYQQIVSRHDDFIPNVYQLGSRVEKAERGYKIGFDQPHHLSKSAKRIRMLAGETDAMQAYGIVAIPSDTEVVVDVPDLHADRVFVYGEEVDDFRTVDYEGLTTLNISATQELSKRLAEQQSKLTAMTLDKDAQIGALREELATQKTRVAALESLAGDLVQMKSQLATLRLQPASAAVAAVVQP
ncbi:tail fiber domain-containing protein [Rudaea sp.]|uniref:tail fiber domain-containing protein n=1 Tax=Rudaea sp. TaxID=2136325 RepID=UPI002ED37B70